MWKPNTTPEWWDRWTATTSQLRIQHSPLTGRCSAWNIIFKARVERLTWSPTSIVITTTTLPIYKAQQSNFEAKKDRPCSTPKVALWKYPENRWKVWGDEVVGHPKSSKKIVFFSIFEGPLLLFLKRGAGVIENFDFQVF